MAGKRWSEKEIIKLKENFDCGIEYLSIIFPNRSVKSIRNKLNELNLDVYKKHTYYSVVEDELLKNNSNKNKDVLMEMLPNRSWDSIRKRIEFLELDRQKGWKYWTNEEVDLLLKSRTLKECCEQIKTRTYEEIQSKAYLLGKSFVDDRIWSEYEINILTEMYSKSDVKLIKEKLPNRSLQSIYNKANKLKLKSFRMSCNVTKEQVIELFEKEDMLIKEIANYLKIDRHKVSKMIPNYLKDNNINKDDFLKMYLQGYSSGHISKKFNISSSYVLKVLHKNHIEVRKSSDYIKLKLPMDEIITLYDNGASATKIAEKYNTSTTTIIKKLKKENVQIYSTNSRYISKEKSYFWKGGISNENSIIRGSVEYKKWRFSVFKRDNFKCQSCFNKKSNKLHAHHILNFSTHKDKRFSVDNGITLCKLCHDPTIKGSFHNVYGTRNNTYDQLHEYITKQLAADIL